jgi:hypothetical protein
MKTRILVLVLALALALFLAAAGISLAYDAVQVPRSVLGGGASDAAGGGVALRATLGQQVVGLVINAGGDVSLGQGFWHGGSLPADRFDIYLPLIKR